MAEQIELEVKPREVLGKASKRLRREGLTPANISGHNEPPQAVQIDTVAFETLRRQHGIRNVLTLRLPDAGTQTAVVRKLQFNPRTGKIVHIDFSRVSMDERITVRVPLHFTGESNAVKNESGTLLHLMEALEVETRASDMVDALEVDITPLQELDAILYARDVKLPAGYTLLTNEDEPIAKVTPPRVEEPVTTGTEAGGEAAGTATENGSEA